MLEEESCGGSDAGVEEVVRVSGRLRLSFDQNSSQNCTNFWTTGPESSTQPSNQVSQLTLQLGRKTFLRSTMMNLGCMTLNGRRNMLLISRSSPWSSEGEGSPSFLVHVSGGYIFPLIEEVWNSFWKTESEENPMRTRIFDPPC